MNTEMQRLKKGQREVYMYDVRRMNRMLGAERDQNRRPKPGTATILGRLLTGRHRSSIAGVPNASWLAKQAVCWCKARAAKWIEDLRESRREVDRGGMTLVLNQSGEDQRAFSHCQGTRSG